MISIITIFTFFLACNNLKVVASVTTVPELSLSVKNTQQAKKVTGKVTDEKGESLVGVSIVIEGTTKGTISDIDGKYTIEVPDENVVLVYSYIGFITQKVQVIGKDVINIILIADSKALTGVTVTAFGVSRRTKSLTYGVQTIKPKEITENRDADIVNSLQGKVVGAAIKQGSGGLGSATSIVLRGNRSLTGSSAALFVIDGVPMDNFNQSTVNNDFGGTYTGANGTSTINPDDVESMTILRGASASALYGSAAANGVILITTKKGKEGKTTIDINSGVSVQSVWGLVPLQNKYGQGIGGTIPNASVIEFIGASWGAEMAGQNYTNHLGDSTSVYSSQPNNVKDFFDKALTFNNSIGITGGNEKAQTFVSYSNSVANGMIPLNKLNKNAVNIRVTNKISSKLSTDVKINYVNQKIEHTPLAGENNAPLFDNYQIPRSMSTGVVQDYSTMVNGIETPNTWPSTLPSVYQNPYWVLNGVDITQTINKVSGYLSAKYELAPWLSIQGRANLDKAFTTDDQSVKDGVLLHSVAGGNFSRNVSELTSKWFDFMLLGSKQINTNFNIDYQAGGIYNDYYNSWLNGAAEGLGITNMFYTQLGITKKVSNGIYHTRTNSLFARTTLAYKDFLFLDASIRNDWTSTLPANNRSYPYGSVGLSAIVSEMVKLPEAISFLKVNVSGAQVGNGTGAYQTDTYYNVEVIDGNTVVTRSSTKANENLKPEITTSYEGSIDIRFIKNRIGFEATLYKTNSINQIISVNMPPASGYVNQMVNAGNIQNTGFEFVLNGIAIRTNKFSWNVALNIGKNNNKLVSLTETVKSSGDPYIRVSGTKYEEGQPLGEIYAYGWDQDSIGNYLVTNKGVPVISADTKRIGNLNPNLILGFNNTFSYNNFSLRVLVDGKIGGVFVSGNEANLAFSGISKITDQNREKSWVLTGTVTSAGVPDTIKIDAQSFWTTVSDKRYAAGEFFAYDATNFRVREVSIGYQIPLDNKYIRSAKISIYGNNLFWIYRGSSLLNIPGLEKRKLPSDPDMTLGGRSNGSDYGVFPSSRVFGLNLQMSF